MPDPVQAAIEALREEVRQLRADLQRRSTGDPDELLTVPEAARELKVTSNAVRMAIYRKTLPSQRVGSRVRIRRGDLTKK